MTSQNYSGFANWAVSDGTVDLIKNGAFGLSGSGMFVDLDGSSANAGKMTTNTSFALAGGTSYELKFDLSGNQRGGQIDSVTVSVGSLYTEVFPLLSGDPWTIYSRTINVVSNTNAPIVFDHAGGDNVGILLDNVSLEVVPEPATLGALGIGVAALAARRRRGK